MFRQEYAHQNKAQYEDWTARVADTPYSAVELMELAIISAHTQFEPMVDGFKATRNAETIDEVADCLYREGVIASHNKAAYIMDVRERCIFGDTPLPEADYRDYRREFKFKGLGHAKLSFAACLIDPQGSDIICLDTHMIEVYRGVKGSSNEGRRAISTLARYEAIEDLVLTEAEEVGLTPFAYQWAVWDWKRGTPEPHSFLGR